MIRITKENEQALYEYHGDDLKKSAVKATKKYIGKYQACADLADNLAVMKSAVSEIGDGDYWLSTRARDLDIALWASCSIPGRGSKGYYDPAMTPVLIGGQYYNLEDFETDTYRCDGYMVDGQRKIMKIDTLREKLFDSAKKTVYEVNKLGKQLDKQAEERMINFSHRDDRRVRKLNAKYSPVPNGDENTSPLDYTVDDVRTAHNTAKLTCYGHDADSQTEYKGNNKTWGSMCAHACFFGDPVTGEGSWVMNDDLSRKLSSLKREYKKRLEWIIPEIDEEDDNSENARPAMFEDVLTWADDNDREASREVVTKLFLTDVDKKMLRTATHRRDADQREEETFEFWARWRREFEAWRHKDADDYDPDSYNPYDDEWLIADDDDGWEAEASARTKEKVREADAELDTESEDKAVGDADELFGNNNATPETTTASEASNNMMQGEYTNAFGYGKADPQPEQWYLDDDDIDMAKEKARIASEMNIPYSDLCF